MILPMVRVELVGPQHLLRAALDFLQARAVLELRTPTAAGVSPLPPAAPDEAEDARLADAVRRIDGLLACLPPPRAGPPVRAGSPGRRERLAPLPPPESEAFPARLAELEGEVGALEARREALAAEREATSRFGQLVVALAPLGRDLAPGQDVELHGLFLRTDPAALALLDAEMRRLTGGVCEVKARALDDETTGVLLVVPRAHGAAVTHLLFERGVGELKLPAHYTGKRLVDLLVLLAARERALPAEIARTAAELEALAAVARPELAAAQRAAGWALERRHAMARCGGTRFAFVVSGYTPAERVPALRAEAAATLGDGIAVFERPVDRAEWGDVPVVLRNRPPIRPFERLLALVPLPRYGSVDPTPWLAVFFPLFFGLVLGDVAFGVIGIAACLLVRWRRWGGTLGRDIAAVGLWCSVSAAVFGLLFGEALGELGVHVGLAPVLLDRRRAFTTFLGIALAVGGAHLAIGMILGIASAARAGHRREAVARAAKLVLLASSAAAICSLLGVLSRAALSPALVGAAVSGGVALLAEGPLAALDVVLALGNVLSYARLMALGLASVMLAEVANLVSEKLEPAAAGVALGVLLHAVNFTLGLISPAIAALRLHYVEFFEKFYDEGGFPFRPFGHAG